jgi:hypothetical protein
MELIAFIKSLILIGLRPIILIFYTTLAFLISTINYNR